MSSTATSSPPPSPAPCTDSQGGTQGCEISTEPGSPTGTETSQPLPTSNTPQQTDPNGVSPNAPPQGDSAASQSPPGSSGTPSTRNTASNEAPSTSGPSSPSPTTTGVTPSIGQSSSSPTAPIRGTGEPAVNTSAQLLAPSGTSSAESNNTPNNPEVAAGSGSILDNKAASISIFVVVAVVAVSLIALGFWLYRRRRTSGARGSARSRHLSGYSALRPLHADEERVDGSADAIMEPEAGFVVAEDQGAVLEERSGLLAMTTRGPSSLLHIPPSTNPRVVNRDSAQSRISGNGLPTVGAGTTPHTSWGSSIGIAL